MKKKNVVLTMTVIAAMALTACGGSGGSAASTGASEGAVTKEAAADGTTKEAKAAEGAGTDDNTLTVWAWDPTNNIFSLKEAEKVYQKDHPDFKLNIVETNGGDIETKITTAAASGDLSTLPDIFLFQDYSYQKFIANYPEVFHDITDSGIDLSQFPEAKKAFSTVAGKNYAVPFDNGAVIGAWRTDFLEKAGYTIDNVTDITWAEFMEIGKKVKETTGLPMLSAVSGEPQLVSMMMQSAGSSYFTEDGKVNIKDNNTLKEAMGLYRQMVEEGIISEVTDWEQYYATFANGTVVGSINGCWMISHFTASEDQSGKWGITNIPKFNDIDGASNYSNNGGSSWTIGANSSKKDLAVDFLKSTYAGSTELYAAILPTGLLATYQPAADLKEYNEPQAFFGDEVIYSKIVEFAAKIPSISTGAYYNDAVMSVGVAISNMIQSGADLDSELQAAQDTVEFNMGG